MPESLMQRLPLMLNSVEALKLPLQTTALAAKAGHDFFEAGFRLMDANWRTGMQMARSMVPLYGGYAAPVVDNLLEAARQGGDLWVDSVRRQILMQFERIGQNRKAELAFLNTFTQPLPAQDWSTALKPREVLLDLPGMRLIDISLDQHHRILNYAVVFAPRAGHHSNVAERVALFMRDRGISRMAVVEQKCAADIPLWVNGERHSEDFEGQINQYRRILACLKERTGRPAHLIAVCQPGPLLMATLILEPHLGRTFGSAGSPMDTQAEAGILTDFARRLGENHIDRIITMCGRKVPAGNPGAGREVYDGALQVLGFYYLGLNQHLRNYKRLLHDLKSGNDEGARRQQFFYQWYNWVHHFPAEFIRDTFKKVFVRNELAHNRFAVGQRVIGLRDYPRSVPIWALGGAKDAIAPPKQATAHLEQIAGLPPAGKLNLICDAGHMGLFRSQKVLQHWYRQIVDFILEHSDFDD